MRLRVSSRSLQFFSSSTLAWSYSFSTSISQIETLMELMAFGLASYPSSTVNTKTLILSGTHKLVKLSVLHSSFRSLHLTLQNCPCHSSRFSWDIRIGASNQYFGRNLKMKVILISIPRSYFKLISTIFILATKFRVTLCMLRITRIFGLSWCTQEACRSCIHLHACSSPSSIGYTKVSC